MSHTVETQTQTQPHHMMSHGSSHSRNYRSVAEAEKYPYESSEHLYAQQSAPTMGAVPQRHGGPQPQSHAAGTNAAGKVLAERYKTKMCKNFIEMGMCPYESRCMFAHGEDELRTAEQNLHDGIVTEDAIRHYKRMQAYKQAAQQAAADAANHGPYGYSAYNQSPVGSMSQGPPSYELSSFASPNYSSGHFTAEESGMGSRKNSSHCMSFANAGETYSYDPYAWTPYHNNANPNCDCADCMYNAEVEYPEQPNAAEEATEEGARLRHNIHDVDPTPYKSANSTAQADVAGHSLRRPMMP